ncbi:peroxiredoxin, Ohr subfamily [Haloechinothrix alba]|uniref:Peroxiredoxin, Ohr subfamily n=1 Tax=Haloechinothrix alba TaxID=664784 RepID=A0A238XXX9_9PSEU|nr:Ohr family peroxiredoxin [Haloechinothrix alba]SNR63550.1 peroxiredoxin, Ohr subfamily [Haloechinothrix alba]
MDALYTAEATARGDGRNGEVVTSDGLIDETLAVPAELGGPGGQSINPEQLFAAGHAVSFHGALRRLADEAGVELPETAVTAQVDIGADVTDTYTLVVRLTAALPGLEEGRANELVAQAHKACPYSRATEGNIEVEVSAST